MILSSSAHRVYKYSACFSIRYFLSALTWVWKRLSGRLEKRNIIFLLLRVYALSPYERTLSKFLLIICAFGKHWNFYLLFCSVNILNRKGENTCFDKGAFQSLVVGVKNIEFLFSDANKRFIFNYTKKRDWLR